MKRRRFCDYVDEKYLAFVENNQQTVFFVLSEIRGFSYEVYLKYLFSSSVSLSWTVCEVAAYEMKDLIAEERLNIFEDGGMSFTARRSNSITDFNLEKIIEL